MKRFALLSAALVGVSLAQAPATRVLKIESKSFTGDLRNGPYTFNGSAAAPIKATVSTIRISAPRAVLVAPSGTPITSAEGKRTADFTGNVTVTRGRLAAKGPSLSYSESTGVGVLKGGASATFASEKKDEDPVIIDQQSGFRGPRALIVYPDTVFRAGPVQASFDLKNANFENTVLEANLDSTQECVDGRLVPRR